MKNFNLKTLSILLIWVTLLCSCNKDDDNDSSDAAEGFVSAKIDGVDWKSSSDYKTTGAKKTGNILAVQGSDNDGNAINFSIANYNGVGTYKTGDSYTNSNQLLYVTINPIVSWFSNLATAALGSLSPGTINITIDDGKTVEGTFSFNGYNGETETIKKITDGEFKASIE